MPSTTYTDGSILRDASTRYRRANREADGSHGAFETESRRAGGAPRAEVTVSRTPAPSDVAEILGVEVGAEVVLRARKMYDGERLVQLADTWIPVDVATTAGIEQVDTGVGGIISRMAEAGYEQTEITEDITQQPASAAAAAALGVEPDAPLLTITHVGRTAAGRAVEVSSHTLGSGWTLRFSVPVA